MISRGAGLPGPAQVFGRATPTPLHFEKNVVNSLELLVREAMKKPTSLLLLLLCLRIGAAQEDSDLGSGSCSGREGGRDFEVWRGEGLPCATSLIIL